MRVTGWNVNLWLALRPTAEPARTALVMVTVFTIGQDYVFLRPGALLKDEKTACFTVGTVIRHRLFGYRGVIHDVDPEFQGTDAWYERMAKSRPPRDAPWYRVLVHGRDIETYVAERNLEMDDSGARVEHPYIDRLFDGFSHGRYHRRVTRN